jgi:hypothetical protein
MLFVSVASASSQTLDSIISNYLSARGQSKFNELKTMIVEGEQVLTRDNINSGVKEYIKYPLKYRIDTYTYEFKMKHSVIINNGKGGILNPFSGTIVKENFNDISIDRIRSSEMSDLQGLLYNWQEKCKKVSFEGKTTLNSIDLYRIRIITNASDTLDYYIDAKDFLLKRVVYFPDFPNPTVLTYSNYKDVNGMQLPFGISQSNGDGSISNVTIIGYSINPVIDDSLFVF